MVVASAGVKPLTMEEEADEKTAANGQRNSGRPPRVDDPHAWQSLVNGQIYVAYANKATAQGATAVGQGNTAQGGFSAAVGFQNTATGFASAAFGSKKRNWKRESNWLKQERAKFSAS